jgi:hypothetical protein
MGRVINIDSVGKERMFLVRSVVAAIREFANHSEPNLEVRDLVSYIILSLDRIFNTIEASVAAWEKRDYWVKADRFRSEWAWTGTLSARMKTALCADDWGTVAQTIVSVGKKLNNVKVPVNNRIGSPWKGSWAVLQVQLEKDN